MLLTLVWIPCHLETTTTMLLTWDSPYIYSYSTFVTVSKLYFSSSLQITSNGLISFGQQFPNFGATLFPNENDITVFTAYLAAPYWSDIDYRTLGDVWYETYATGQSSTSNTLLERVSNLVRSEQNVPTFQGTWMLVATWNSTVPFAGSGSVVCTTVLVIALSGHIIIFYLSNSNSCS